MVALRDDPIDERRLTLGQHLEELRYHVLKAVLYIAVALTACMCFQEELMAVALRPHRIVEEEFRHEARTRLRNDGLPSSTVDAAREWAEGHARIKRSLREAEREAATVHEKLERDPAARAERITKDQRELEKKLEALRVELTALAKNPDEAKARALDERRVALAREAAELEVRASSLAALLEDDAKARSVQLVNLTYPEAFMAYLWVAFVASVFFASPLVLRELWRFIAKGLYPHEKRYIKIFAPLSLVSFIAGGSFGYFLVIPTGLKYLAEYASADIAGQFALSDYLSLFIGLTVALGVMFELPLVMCFVALLGFMKPDTYAGFRRYWVLVAFIVAALITPGSDPLTLFICAIPLIVLFELGIWLSRFVTLRAGPPPEDAPPRPRLEAPSEPPPAIPPPTFVLPPPPVETYPETPVAASESTSPPSPPEPNAP